MVATAGENAAAAAIISEACPNLWTNHAATTDIGLNWYLNFYARIYLDWQHAMFGNQVSVAPGRFSSTTDLFWLRFQIFF